MARPTDSYPTTATNGARKAEPDSDGTEALEDVLRHHGDDIAAAVDHTDELNEVLTTAILILASADAEDVEYLTDSTVNLVETADGLATSDMAALADDVGANAEELSETLDTVVQLQQAGHVDEFVTLATALTNSLSSDEIEELAGVIEENGPQIVESLDLVLELQREDHLEDLIETAKTLSVLTIDPDTADVMNDMLGALGEAERDAQPVGLFGTIRKLRGTDARAGLGYLVAFLKSLGRKMNAK